MHKCPQGHFSTRTFLHKLIFNRNKLFSSDPIYVANEEMIRFLPPTIFKQHVVVVARPLSAETLPVPQTDFLSSGFH